MIPIRVLAGVMIVDMQSGILVVWVLAATTTSAQWLHYPTAGIPRTRDGKPNLTAPAPKTRDHKPDLSGLWLPENDPATKGTNGELLPKLFIDVGRGTNPGELSMQPWAQALMAARSRNFQADDPITACKAVGGPRLNYIPTPIKIVQNPGLIVRMHEEETTFRQIYTDGRKLPEDPEPSTLGYSTGRWERDALIVETIGFHDQGWLDAIGHPYSDALHVTERFQRRDFGHIKVQITINDPKAYKQPFTLRQDWAFLPDTDLLEYHCADNERDVRHFVLK
jgi:hypothetical protein